MRRFELLNKYHNKQDFDCGNEPINQYLKTMATQHDKKGIAKVHILSDDKGDILGFYTLSNTRFDNDDNQIKGYPKQIPAILIGRMAVNVIYQNQGIANLLIANALHNIKTISQMTGIAFVLIDAKTPLLAEYYERKGFYRLPNSLRLIYPVNQINLMN